jgi:hypothetical protein
MTGKTNEAPTEPLTAHGGGYLATPYEDGERAEALLSLAATDPECARLITDLYARIEDLAKGGGHGGELAKLDRRIADIEARQAEADAVTVKDADTDPAKAPAKATGSKAGQ